MAVLKLTKSSCFFAHIPVSFSCHTKRNQLSNKLLKVPLVFQQIRPIENYQNVILNVALPADRQGSEVDLPASCESKLAGGESANVSQILRPD